MALTRNDNLYEILRSNCFDLWSKKEIAEKYLLVYLHVSAVHLVSKIILFVNALWVLWASFWSFKIQFLAHSDWRDLYPTLKAKLSNMEGSGRTILFACFSQGWSTLQVLCLQWASLCVVSLHKGTSIAGRMGEVVWPPQNSTAEAVVSDLDLAGRFFVVTGANTGIGTPSEPSISNGPDPDCERNSGLVTRSGDWIGELLSSGKWELAKLELNQTPIVYCPKLIVLYGSALDCVDCWLCWLLFFKLPWNINKSSTS